MSGIGWTAYSMESKFRANLWARVRGIRLQLISPGRFLEADLPFVGGDSQAIRIQASVGVIVQAYARPALLSMPDAWGIPWAGQAPCFPAVPTMMSASSPLFRKR